MRPTHGYCPECKEESAIDRDSLCLWCGGPTEQRAKRGGWTRPDLRGSKFSEAQLRALHVAHMRGGSINSLAEQTFEVVGYASKNSAAVAISRSWRQLGLRARDRIEMVVAVSTRHGRAPRKGRDNAAYRRWFKQQNGRYQPRCAAVKRQPPRKGEPCKRPAMEGSDYCQSHDPVRELVRQAHLAGMRKRQPSKPMVPVEPFAEWLRCRRDQLGTFTAVAERVGLSNGLVGCYAKCENAVHHDLDEIGRDVVERCLEADGTTIFTDIYPDRRDLRAAA